MKIETTGVKVIPIKQMPLNGAEKDFDIFMQDPIMRVGLKPMTSGELDAVGVINGEIVTTRDLEKVYLTEGAPMPFSLTYVPVKTVREFQTGIQKVALLDRVLKESFSTMFTEPHSKEKASFYLRYMFNVQEGEDPYVEKLTELYNHNPRLCREYVHSYRGDGRVLENGHAAFNEVNSIPGGTCWMPTYSKFLLERGVIHDVYGLDKLYPQMSRYISDRAANKAIFFPALDLANYKVLGEAVLWMQDLHQAGIESYIGELKALKVSLDGKTWLQVGEHKVEVGYLDGLSNPETLKSRPDLIKAISEGQLVCPSVGDLIGICNKGSFVLLTALREGRFSIDDFKIDARDFRTLVSSIPPTYWLRESGRSLDEAKQFLSGKYILKPFNLVGGAGFIPHPTPEDIAAIDTAGNSYSYLAQERMSDFDMEVDYNGNSLIHRGSIDPYYQVFRSGKPQSLGFITRGSSEGVSNVSAHVGDNENKFTNHIAPIVRS